MVPKILKDRFIAAPVVVAFAVAVAIAATVEVAVVGTIRILTFLLAFIAIDAVNAMKSPSAAARVTLLELLVIHRSHLPQSREAQQYLQGRYDAPEEAPQKEVAAVESHFPSHLAAATRVHFVGAALQHAALYVEDEGEGEENQLQEELPQLHRRYKFDDLGVKYININNKNKGIRTTNYDVD